MSNPGYKRSKRLNDLLHQSISSLLLTEAKDPSVKTVTITQVLVADDMTQARVYYRCIDGEEGSAEAALGLKRVKGFVRGELGKRLHIKKIPELIFVYDQSIENSQRIDQLLHQLADERADSEHD